MATKAQLEAELAALKAQLASRPESSTADPASVSEESASAGTAEEAKDRFTELLREQGIDPTEIETLWSSLSHELEDLTRDKPLVTAIAAFALGFALGRITKS
ncbi:hypothetical protein [Primorskyibacter sp. S87]|uniref:hypothetical protein n=1 Tax=Primorskyibacter sp. S87 TaxID=3415126 RepID=UPI003C7E49F0